MCVAFCLSFASSPSAVVSNSGIYNWLYTVGFNSVWELYNFVIRHEFLVGALLVLSNMYLIYSCQFTGLVALNKLGIVRCISEATSGSFFRSGPKKRLDRCVLHIKVHPIFIWPYLLFARLEPRANLINIAAASFGWSLHLAYLSSKAIYTLVAAYAFYTGDWLWYSRILTWLGGLKSNTSSLYLTDIAHHHFAVGFLSVHVHIVYCGYPVNETSTSEHLKAKKSLHLELSLCLLLCMAISIAALFITPLTPYLYLCYDYLIIAVLYVHHSSIALFLMIGSFAHASIFLIRDITDILWVVLEYKASIISHLT